MMMEEVQDILTALAHVTPTTRSEAITYHASIRQHVALLSKRAPEIVPVILGNTKEILESLDPCLHSISYLFVLQNLADAVDDGLQIPLKLLLDTIVEFVIRFDLSQIRYAGNSLLALVDKIGSGHLFSAPTAVELMSAVILRIDPTASLFTSTHFMLARLAYHSNSIESALPVVDRDILFYPNPINTKEDILLCDPSLPPSSFISTQTGLTNGITPAMVMEYNYVRGLMYMSRRDWTKAEDAFEQAISHPAKDRIVSKIMVEAYKRWVLVALLGRGRVSPLPSSTSAAVQTAFRLTARAYNHVAEAFALADAGKLKSQAQDNASIWEEDGTSSLVQEVLTYYQKWQILGLRQIYERADMAMVRQVTWDAETGNRLEDDDAVLALTHQMIEDGMLSGQVEQDDSGTYLSFRSCGGVMTEMDFAAQIAQSYHNIESISKQFKQMNEQLSSSKEYVKYLAREQKRATKDNADAGVGFDSQIEDEDLMSGVALIT